MSAAATITVLTGLLTLSMQAADAAQKLGALMEEAREEGRDITPEELQQFIDARHAAEDAWDNKD